MLKFICQESYKKKINIKDISVTNGVKAVIIAAGGNVG